MVTHENQYELEKKHNLLRSSFNKVNAEYDLFENSTKLAFLKKKNCFQCKNYMFNINSHTTQIILGQSLYKVTTLLLLSILHWKALILYSDRLTV